jgi:hypothetical protein
LKGADIYEISFTATVPAGETVYFMWFLGMYPDQAGAVTAAGIFDDVSPASALVADLTPTQLSRIANWDFSAQATVFFLHGIGGTANPPTLTLDELSPTATTAKFRDSGPVNFSGGNAWREIGAWNAGSVGGTVTALSDLHVWLGLKNSDDQGTRFDLRAEIYRNEELVAAGLTRCIQGITRNANQAKEVAVALELPASTDFDETEDELKLTVLTRIGTNPDDTKCSGHNNAVGLRLYFDAITRAAQFGVVAP